MILRYSPRARLQLLAINDHLRREAHAAVAVRVGAQIRDATEILRHFPFAGRAGIVSGTREWIVRQLPYVIVYEVVAGKPDELVILGVFHCRENRG
jgi:plasmid stabilization system protein ParE